MRPLISSQRFELGVLSHTCASNNRKLAVGAGWEGGSHRVNVCKTVHSRQAICECCPLQAGSPVSSTVVTQDTCIGALAAGAMPAQLLSRCMLCSMQAVARIAVSSRSPMQSLHQPRAQQQLVSLRSFAAAPPGLRHRACSARQRIAAAAGAQTEHTLSQVALRHDQLHAQPGECHHVTTAGQDGDADFAVFRFTLGIPGFDDDLIPRVVGCLGAVLLVANHIAAGPYTTAAQVTACMPAQLPAH